MKTRSSVASAVSLLVGCGAAAFSYVGTAAADDSILKPGALIISSSTYEGWRGAVASLQAGVSQLPGSAVPGAFATAVSGNNYTTVWNNDTIDGSFGVTSPIELTAIDADTGWVLGRERVPTREVVTSFSSKSELGLHVTSDERGRHLTFGAYAGAGVGSLDVSNADAVAGQDPTNPVTAFFGTTHSYARTIVALDEAGRFSYTPTVNYGGNNGRSAVLAPNGLYYTVGNGNNGNAATFGSASNGTSPDVTETTGVEVVNPINAWSALNVTIPAGNSAEVNPLLQYGLGKKGANDKPGKDNNFRGITEYNGALYFTKGSGSNGVNTVYTIVNNVAQSATGAIPAADSNGLSTSGVTAGNVLPTVANAGSVSIQILNGFPADSARSTGGNFTPFAIFFANDTTMYVSDEGSGNATDAASHAGLEKWVLVNGTWTLQYVLTQGLIGAPSYTLNGYDGEYPAVSNAGLRNLAGRVNKDGTVTLWAATSTASASGDQGADPNEVVEITDKVSATTLPSTESFRVVAAPVYGKVYRGVAYVPADEGQGYGRGGDHGWY